MPPSSVAWAVVIVSVLAGTVRLSFVKYKLDLNVARWIVTVLAPGALVAGVCSLAMRFIVISMKSCLAELVLLFVANTLLTAGLSWIVSTKTEHLQWKTMAFDFFFAKRSQVLDVPTQPPTP
jgi:hypothetical protein